MKLEPSESGPSATGQARVLRTLLSGARSLGMGWGLRLGSRDQQWESMGCRTGPGLPCPAGRLSSLLPALGHLACSIATFIRPVAAGRTEGPEHCSPRSLPSVVTVTWAPRPSFPCPPPSPLPSAQGPNNMWVWVGG